MHYSRGQGATEYLVVLGAVLLVSMVVVQAVSSSSSSGIALKEQQSTTYWKSATPFSISSYTMEGGMLAAVVKNGLAEPLKLTSVQVTDNSGTSTLWSGSAVVSGGAETTLFMRYGLNNSCKNSAGGNPFEITQITFNYDKTSVSGLKQIGDKSLAGKCAAQQGIVFRAPTPADNAAASANSNISINATIDGTTAIRLKDFGLVWNGTNTSFYDDSLVLAMNFDDVYELGERGGKVVDVSNYGNNGTIYGNTAGLWHFDEADGNRTVDESRFGNNGTLFGNTRLLLHLDEGSGTLTQDYSGYNSTCRLGSNLTWAAGRAGNAIMFYGDHASRITCTNTSAFNITNNLTITAWVKLANNLNSAIMGRESGGPRTFTFRKSISNSVCFEWSQNNTVEGSVYNTCTTAGIDDNWHHVAVSFASGQYKIYVDGQLNVSGTSAITSIYTGTNPNITIGYSVWSSDYDANGTIDEVGLYAAILNATQIAQQYNEGRARFSEWVDGKSGAGLQFDGLDDYVSIPNNSNLAIRGALSIEAWVKYNWYYGVIVTKYKPGYQLGDYSLTTSSFDLYVDNLNYPTGYYSLAFSPPAYNVWTHLVATYNGTDMMAYKNGALVASRSIGAHVIDASGAGLAIGENAWHDPGFRLPFNGSIDEVGIYNRSLSASEVLARYNAGRAKHADWDASGKAESGIKFDGVNDYVNCGSGASLNATEMVTLAYWYNRTGPNMRSYTEDRVGRRYSYWSSGSGSNAFYGSLSGQVDRILAVAPVFSTGVWHHFAFTYNSSNMQGKAYMDGVLQDTRNASVNYPGLASYKLDSTANPLVISDQAYTVNGSIDEVRIWNRVLSSAEIRQQYYSSLNKYAPDRWIFNSTQTFLPAGTHTYYLYTNGTDGSSDFTEERTLRVT